MVQDPGAATGADSLRPLNRPRPAVVLVGGGAGRPVGLVERGRRRRVARVKDGWRIDDEWWREPIRRRYYRLVLDDGSLRTVFRDEVDGRWYAQAY